MGMFKSESLGSFVGISTGEPMTTTELTDTQESGAYLSAAPHKLRIDVHAHIYPPEYLDLLDNMGGGGTGTHIARILSGSGSPEELAARFEMMDRAGVQMQILSAGPEFPYFDKKEDAVTAARYINDVYADYVLRHPERFVALVVLPMPHVDDAIEEMRRGLDTLGMVGVTMGTSVLAQSVTDPMFDPIWAEMNRRGTILFFHPHGLCACSQLIAPSLAWPIGAPIEDTVLIAHLLASEIPKRYPRVRIIVPHLGGMIPMLMQRLDNQRGLYMPAEAEQPSVTLKRFWYDTVSHAYTPALRLACEAFGPERILLGSDYPFEVGEVFQQCVDHVQNPDVGITPDEAEGILDRNAQALFQLTPKRPSAV
jgi:6-methylsalicylate decarboxylase